MKESSCVYLINDDQWLFLLRNKKDHDVNRNKYIGVGGKKENNETIRQCAIREVKEETGLLLVDLEERGTVLFHYPHIEDERITIFTANQWCGEIHLCDEGELVWIDRKDILKLNLWPGDRIFLKKLMDEEKKQFHMQLFYNESDELIDSMEE